MKSLQRLIRGMLFVSPFFFPLYLFRFKLAGIPFTVLEVFIYVLFGVYLLCLMFRQFKLTWEKPLSWAYYLAFVLLLGSIFGVLTAPHQMPLITGEVMDSQKVAMGILKGWILAPMLYFFMFTQGIRNSVDLKKILLAFIGSGALVALVSYFFGLFGTGFASDLRLVGFFESANYLALYLVPALLLSFSYLFQPALLQGKEKFLNLISGAIMLHALLMTQSYAGILAVFGALGLWVLILLIKHRKTSRKLFWSFIAMVVVFIGLILSQLNSPKFQQFLDWENRSSTSVRLEIYRVSLDLIKAHPLTGIGPGLFQQYYQEQAPKLLKRAPLEWYMPHPHNIFLAFWLNAGLLGFLAFLGFLILAHRRFIYPLIAFWGILIHGLFDMPFWKNDLAMIFWLVLGAILILQRESKQAN